jgi:hypothetical protein
MIVIRTGNRRPPVLIGASSAIQISSVTLVRLAVEKLTSDMFMSVIP